MKTKTKKMRTALHICGRRGEAGDAETDDAASRMSQLRKSSHHQLSGMAVW